ncbi:MAG TPA: outer membrane protein assembly factor BamE [Thermohalobaculum sp.]|nr:outer membrane protein assembly factor BamE [Thermohalobaculum sp.]
MKRVAGLVLAVVLGAGLSGCAAEVKTHGYAPDDEQIAEIAAGTDTRGSVRRKIGRPSTSGVFTEDSWYYVSTTVEHYMYHEPKVSDRRVVAIEFDTNEVVSAVNVFGLEDGRIIDLQTRTTPTHGRQLTILQQALGNFGKLTGEDLVQ